MNLDRRVFLSGAAALTVTGCTRPSVQEAGVRRGYNLAEGADCPSRFFSQEDADSGFVPQAEADRSREDNDYQTLTALGWGEAEIETYMEARDRACRVKLNRFFGERPTGERPGL